MAYNKTVWVNGQAPALSAVNLNKLTNELELQAIEIGLADQPLPLAVLDNFNRANENPLSQSGAWTTVAGLTPLKIVSNQMLASAAWSAAYRGSYTNVEATVKLGTIASSSNDFEIWLRLKDAGAVSPIRDSNKSCYSFFFDGKANYAIYNFTNGVNTATLKAITAWAGGALADGDTVGCRAVGTTLEVWVKRGAGAWTKEFSMTNSTHTAAGAIGFVSESLTSTFDDFGGGEVAPGHTLPNWADGVAPALTDPVPLNEMERILDLVAADQGLSYTPTVWAAGWSPARNAINLNKMENQAANNRVALDPVATSRGLGYFTLASGWLGSNSDKYDRTIIGRTNAQAAAAQLANPVMTYFSGMSVKLDQYTHVGVGYSQAQSLGAILKDTNGNNIYSTMSSPSGSAVIGDVGLPAYQDAWCANVLAILQSLGCEGFYNDDCNMSWAQIGGAVTFAKYPTQASQQAAMKSFCVAIGAYFRSRGYYVAHNAKVFIAGDGRSDTGELTKIWWTEIGPHSDGLMCEFDIIRSNGDRRLVGPESYNNWDGWRSVHSHCLAINNGTGGVGLLQLDEGDDPTAKDYGLATFLLDFDGVRGVHMWQNNPGYADPWSPVSDRVYALGAPLGAATKSGNVWTRQFANGTVTVNPVAGTNSIT